MGVRVPDCSSSVQIVELGSRRALSKLSREGYIAEGFSFD